MKTELKQVQLARVNIHKAWQEYEQDTNKAIKTDFKTIRKKISRQLDLLEKNIIDIDDEKTQKVKKTIGTLMLDLINKNHNDYASLSGRRKVGLALRKFGKAKRAEKKKKTKRV